MDDLAFCCENAKEIASKMFVQLAAGQRDFQSDQLLDRVKDGYVSNDMNRYLHFLVKEKKIESFTFKRILRHHFNNIFNYLFIHPLADDDEFTYLFMGYSLPAHEKLKITLTE